MGKGLDSLREYLADIPPGAIGSPRALEDYLENCWDELEGHTGGMAAHKVRERIEDVEWNPPKLTFAIERHGGTALGSVYAETQCWSVDVERGLAMFEPGKRRLVGIKQRPLKVEPIAIELIDLILAGKADPRLKWYGQSKVKIRMGEVLPEGTAEKETLAGRRKRLGKALQEGLKGHGWYSIPGTSPHTYDKRK